MTALPLLVTLAIGSVRIGTNASAPFQFALDGSENSIVVANMTSLTGVSGIYVTKLSSAGKIVYSDRLGYSVATAPFASFLDSAGECFVVDSMTALNGVSGLYVTKINTSGAIVYTTRLGTSPATQPFAATLDPSGNVHVVTSMKSLSGVAGLYSIKLNTAGATVYSVSLGTKPATAPFAANLDSAGNEFTLSSLTAANGVSGLYLSKLSTTGSLAFNNRIGYNAATAPYGNGFDSSANLFSVSSMTSTSGVSGLFLLKVNANGTTTFSSRLGYSPATSPFWATLDSSDNTYTVSNLTNLSGVTGLFYSKTNSSGTTIYNGRLGYSPASAPFAVTVDSSSNLYSVANMTALNGSKGLYYSKLNATGTVVYNDRLGSNPAAVPFDARLDGSGNAFAFSNMTATTGVSGLYVTKLSSTGAVSYMDRIGYNPAGFPFGDYVDSASNVYTVASMTGLSGTTGLYFTKLSSTGKVTYNVRVGINAVAPPFSYWIDGSGNVLTLANMSSLTGAAGLYLNKVGATGTVAYSVRLGSNPASTGYAYYLDGSGNAFCAASMTSLSGVTGLYVSKLSASGATLY
ncbi:MAG: hypothetical protein P4L46_07520 [Fimbriimonas sp.]|nr:hypothetical protein [Fimbriimonas sp.]